MTPVSTHGARLVRQIAINQAKVDMAEGVPAPSYKENLIIGEKLRYRDMVPGSAGAIYDYEYSKARE